MNIISFGGESKHYPSHMLTGTLAAFVVGSDYTYLNIHNTKDNQIVASEFDDLSFMSDKNGMIKNVDWEYLKGVDFGHTFNPNQDFPYRKVRIPYERTPDGIRYRSRAPICSFENLLKKNSPDAKFILNIDPIIDSRLESDLIDLIETHDQSSYIILTSAKEKIKNLEQVSSSKIEGIGIHLNTENNLTDLSEFINKSLYVFGEVKQMNSSFENFKIAINFDDNEALTTNCWGGFTRSVLEYKLNQNDAKIYFGEEFKGNTIRHDYWLSGISCGFELPSRLLADAEKGTRLAEDTRASFDAKLYVKDGLHIDIEEGDQYASAGVVAKFPVRGEFSVEVSFSYSNPERATMMAIGFRNTSVFPTHAGRFDDNGNVNNPRWNTEHPVFDTHGSPPFVLIEHEENDGNRMTNNKEGSGFYKWYNNFYHPNVGNGSINDLRFKLVRKGKFFCSYYKDNDNPNWVGVGAVENESLNDEVYLCLGAKHYPKRGAPNPLPKNHVIFKDVKIFKYEFKKNI